jgi:hypothetical protein
MSFTPFRKGYSFFNFASENLILAWPMRLCPLKKPGAMFAVPFTNQISTFRHVISIGKPISEIPPNPPLQRGAGEISGKSFQKAKQLRISELFRI